MVSLIAPLRFTPSPVSWLVVIIYATIFISVLVNDQTPDIPKSEGGLNITNGFHDLQTITSHPRPFSSHQNDGVRAFLLDRVQSIASQCDYIQVADDLVSNASYTEGATSVYFEGNNILVKVAGTHEGDSGDGVLISAHYDSVSTEYGATDNGMGVVTVLQLLEYFSVPERRPRRTAVFFLNNGEEDGLNGAHVYYEHPWSKLTSTFINLEGAGAGGRPLVFRSTSLRPVKAFSSPNVDHPSASVVGADAFARGVIQSRTDFQVFAKGIEGETAGMEGVDFAFFRNRALYHTLLDSIPGMGSAEGRKALWAMMDATKGASLAMLNDKHVDDPFDGGVYFDLYGSALLAFPRRYLFIVNIALLVVGPISVFIFLAWVLILSAKYTNAGLPEEHHDTWTKTKKVILTTLGWGRFWFAIVICILCQVGLVAGFVKLNPFVVHSYPTIVVTNTLCLAYLGLVLPFSLFEFFFPSPPSSQKLATILELFFLVWIFLVVSTVAVGRLQIGSSYWVTAWYLCTWVAALIALGEGAQRAKNGGEEGGKGELNLVGEPRPEDADVGERRFVRGIRYDRLPEAENGERGRAPQDDIPVETEPTEITPLIRQQRRRSQGGSEYVLGIDGELTRVDDGKRSNVGYQETGWWIAQMLALVPFPALLEFSLLVLLVHSLKNTMVDGSSPLTVYAAISALSTLIMLNITPFAHRLSRGLTWTVLLIFLFTLLFSWTAFPFTQDAPLKVFFQQRLDLALPTQLSPHGSISRVETLLTGPNKFVDKHVIPLIPSSLGNEVICGDGLRKNLRTCQWDTSGLLPSPGGARSKSLAPASLIASSHATRASDWLSASFTRHAGQSATISIRGVNTRTCSLKFDTPISTYSVRGSSGRMQPGYGVPPEGLTSLSLWSREWEKEFVVDFMWEGANNTMEGRVSCNWAEYASATAGSEWAGKSGQIPALEEVMRFVPLWVVPTKLSVGLVEAGARFSV
ncbi:hypothetical protein BXZ70DRAFT_926000 [Cristinia sonorae]|uniref:Peptide hydrolase n=1 Tax=Cristinia sonorae TaxID=1940300 RepID=A0A8K0XS73_9AGAR|nr:hypothetical protein BXZ70DRAFT_926000 [Cristinia sonorae]